METEKPEIYTYLFFIPGSKKKALFPITPSLMNCCGAVSALAVVTAPMLQEPVIDKRQRSQSGCDDRRILNYEWLFSLSSLNRTERSRYSR